MRVMDLPAARWRKTPGRAVAGVLFEEPGTSALCGGD
jgi:hypothetical protein